MLYKFFFFKKKKTKTILLNKKKKRKYLRGNAKVRLSRYDLITRQVT